MIGKLYIDGIDAYTNYGLYIVKGSYNDLLAYPQLKQVETVDYPEDDGVEVDLTNPVLKSKEISIKFGMSGNNYDGFFNMLYSAVYHEFNFAAIGLTATLRLSSQNSLKQIRNLSVFALKFNQDSPIPGGYQYKSPASSINIPATDYILDGKNLSEYGIRVLLGTKISVLKKDDLKQNLAITNNTMNGAIYDPNTVAKKGGTISLNLLMKANSYEEFYRNYWAFLHDLTKPETRILQFNYLNYSLSVYYQSCKVLEFTSYEWFKFSIDLMIFGGKDRLITQDGAFYIISQDGYYLY